MESRSLAGAKLLRFLWSAYWFNIRLRKVLLNSRLERNLTGSSWKKNLGKFRRLTGCERSEEIFSLTVVQGFFLKRKTRADTKSVLVSHR